MTVCCLFIFKERKENRCKMYVIQFILWHCLNLADIICLMAILMPLGPRIHWSGGACDLHCVHIPRRYTGLPSVRHAIVATFRACHIFHQIFNFVLNPAGEFFSGFSYVVDKNSGSVTTQQAGAAFAVRISYKISSFVTNSVGSCSLAVRISYRIASLTTNTAGGSCLYLLQDFELCDKHYKWVLFGCSYLQQDF